MKAEGEKEESNSTQVDFRGIRYKGLNIIVTTGWVTTMSILLIPLWVYSVFQNAGSERFIVALFFPLGIVIVSVVSAQLVVLSIFVGLRVHKYVFRKNK